jgi:hypothetical protein
MMRVKPKDGRTIVRDPITKEPLPATGKRVPNNSFWRRRIKAGDAVLVEDTPPPAPAPQKTKVDPEDASGPKRKPAKKSDKK